MLKNSKKKYSGLSGGTIVILALMLAVWVGYANAVEWRTLNQATVAWDAVTTLSDGSALPAGHVIQYRVYTANAITDPSKANPALSGETDQLEYTITLTIEGKYFIGVQSVRYDETGAEIGVSDINWSDVNGEATPNPFGLQHYIPPMAPKNFR